MGHHRETPSQNIPLGQQRAHCWSANGCVQSGIYEGTSHNRCMLTVTLATTVVSRTQRPGRASQLLPISPSPSEFFTGKPAASHEKEEFCPLSCGETDPEIFGLGNTWLLRQSLVGSFCQVPHSEPHRDGGQRKSFGWADEGQVPTLLLSFCVTTGKGLHVSSHQVYHS